MSLNEYPRVLVVTVNPFSSTSNNGKTYASFFKDYPKECIAQLYFRNELPDSSVCENYYRICDRDIFNNLFFKSSKIGQIVSCINKENTIKEKTIVNEKMKKSSFIRFVRSLLWYVTNLEKGDLKKWLEDFDPEVIFFCGGDANYIYSKVINISKKFNTKIAYYITDDYVLPYFSLNPIYLLNRYWTKRVFLKMCKRSDLVLTIGDKMSRTYKERFGIDSIPIMNLVNINNVNSKNINIKRNNIKFVYTGGLHSNRWKTLGLIGKSLQRLNELGIRGNLDIYSQDNIENEIFKEINNDFSKYCGSLDAIGVKKVLQEADVLVHVESFDNSSKRTTYLSISTKIPEYMAMGKCVLAMGPSEVASIEYIKETNAGYVIMSTKEEEIDECLKDIIYGSEKRQESARQALDIAKANHDMLAKRYEFQLKLKALSRDKRLGFDSKSKEQCYEY